MPHHTDSSSIPIDRRTFVKSISAAGLGMALGASVPAGAAEPSAKPPSGGGASLRRYAIVGVGSRAEMYLKAIEADYKQYAQLVGICDVNPGRLEFARKKSEARGAKPPPAYAPADFEKMLRENNVDTCIVTTVDQFHNEYIVRALNAGVDVVTEKPMTTTAEKCQQIFDARAKTGKKVRVTFNYR
jgi:predicted dehydrogenase